MSSKEIAVRIDHVFKRFEIYDAPINRLKQAILPTLHKLFHLNIPQYFHEFLALKDVSITIKKRETVGIIGRNGSGKSTLLQIICGTLSPTSGDVFTNGRVAALLELGSGFNPEFTGRENVYLNGAVLGLSRKEIDSRFDDIAKFADIGEFIDQPTKTYSSGMMVRLAFAVIAHVDANILIVDEALSVGDAVFTQKCMRFIRKFQEQGSLIFVSHDMGAVQNLCDTAIWLNKGEVMAHGPVKEVSEKYLEFTVQEIYGEEIRLDATSILESEDRQRGEVISSLGSYGDQLTIKNNLEQAKGWKTGIAYIDEITIQKLNGHNNDIFIGGEMVRITIYAHSSEVLERPIVGFLFRDKYGQDLFGENTLSFTRDKNIPLNPERQLVASFDFVLPMLPNGSYSVMASLADGDLVNHIQHHWLHDALIIEVVNSKVRYGLVGIPFQKVNLEVIDE